MLLSEIEQNEEKLQAANDVLINTNKAIHDIIEKFEPSFNQVKNGEYGLASSLLNEKNSNGSEQCTVKLINVGIRKVKLIQIIKDAFGLGLAEAKEYVDNAPVIIDERISKQEANILIEEANSIEAVIKII